MRARGFTLLEMMAALAISGIIAAASMTAFIGISHATRRVEQQAHADAEAKQLVDYLMGSVQQAGGGLVRPWMGIAIDDNCTTSLTVAGQTLPACDGSDRLHIATPDPDGNQCTIVSVSGSTITSTGTGATCCLNATDFEKKPLLIMAGDSTASAGEWRTDFCDVVDTTACTCTLKGDSAYQTAGAGTADFSGGVMTAGNTLSFFLDPPSGVLEMLSSEDDGTPAISELADHVGDLQVELGFDTTGDQVVDLEQPGYASVDRTLLRMIHVGIIASVPVPVRETRSSAQLFDGPVRSATHGRYFHAISTRATLRNLNLFY